MKKLFVLLAVGLAGCETAAETPGPGASDRGADVRVIRSDAFGVDVVELTYGGVKHVFLRTWWSDGIALSKVGEYAP